MDGKLFDHISILHSIREKNRKIADQFYKKISKHDGNNDLLVNILERNSSLGKSDFELDNRQRNTRPSLTSMKSCLTDSVMNTLTDTRKKVQNSRKRKSFSNEPKIAEQPGSHLLYNGAASPALQIHHYATLINALNQQFIAANPFLVQNYMAQYLMNAAKAAATTATGSVNSTDAFTANHNLNNSKNGIYQKKESPNNISAPLNDSIYKLKQLNIDEIKEKVSTNSSYETQEQADYESCMKDEVVDLSYSNITQRKKSRSDIHETNYNVSSRSTKLLTTSSHQKPFNNYVIIPKKFMPLISTRIRDWLDKLTNVITTSPKLINLSNELKLSLLEGCWHRLLLTYMIENDFEFFVTKDLQQNEIRKRETSKDNSIDHLPTEADVRQLQTIIEKGHDLGIDDITYDYVRKIILYKEGQATSHSSVFKDAEAEIQIELKSHLESRSSVKIIYSRLLLFLPNVYNVKKEIIEKLFWKFISDDDLFDYLRERITAHGHFKKKK